MLLNTLLARATGLPRFEFWRDLAPRRFFIQCLLTDVIRATETLPISKADGTFAVLSTAPHGLPETLPEGWSEIGRKGDHFAIFRAPAGTSSRGVTEALALELIPLFYPSETYEQKLFNWLEKELGPDQDEEGTFPEGSGPDAPGPCPLRPVRCLDIPSPANFLNPKSEQEQDLDYLYGNGRIPPGHLRYRQTLEARLDPSFGPPETSDSDIQIAEESNFPC
ncbi:hypothetical protein FUA23_10925 [Neolewinella aurantiaca]|uniref:Uncharacterized protein n=1 Tax=Neolewinella aurantiaca TaxID=2602767 RepID=A0A5C7FFY4_9BACT|nr:hypothetical protein [Neolewinella aurantiaca]TXF89256.1 hypothetical protein FUA23_10925 [Neolewinella aurantiaca]